MGLPTGGWQLAGRRRLSATAATVLATGLVAGCGGASGSTPVAPQSNGSGVAGRVEVVPGRVPDLVGLTMSQAQRSADANRLSVWPAAERLVTSVPAGTVISQTLRPGGRMPELASLEVTVAVGPAAVCTAAQMRLTDRGGVPATGNNFDTLDLRNVSSRWCLLAGTVSVVGVDATGRAVTDVAAIALDHRLELSPRAPHPTMFETPLADIAVAVRLQGAGRDDTQPNGVCADQVVPATWRLTLPDHEVVTVRNGHVDNTSLHQFMACNGVIGAALESDLGISP